MECPFFVGQRVVCIEEWNKFKNNTGIVTPVKGKIYTIRYLRTGFKQEQTHTAFYLVFNEIVNKVIGGIEPAFLHHGFSAVDETKIDVFKKMLDSSFWNDSVEKGDKKGDENAI